MAKKCSRVGAVSLYVEVPRVLRISSESSDGTGLVHAATKRNPVLATSQVIPGRAPSWPKFGCGSVTGPFQQSAERARPGAVSASGDGGWAVMLPSAVAFSWAGGAGGSVGF